MRDGSEPRPGAALARLRRATGPQHARLEGRLDVPGLDLDRYRALLVAFHAFYATLEPAIERHSPHGGTFGPLRRTPWLLADLAALGATAGPERAEVPAIERPEHAAGSLYVVEGASLGGRVVARALAPRLGLDAGRGASFFAGLGAGTRARWLAFGAWIEAFAARSPAPEAIDEAACATFAALERHLERAGVLR